MVVEYLWWWCRCIGGCGGGVFLLVVVYSLLIRVTIGVCGPPGPSQAQSPRGIAAKSATHRAELTTPRLSINDPVRAQSEHQPG